MTQYTCNDPNSSEIPWDHTWVCDENTSGIFPPDTCLGVSWVDMFLETDHMRVSWGNETNLSNGWGLIDAVSRFNSCENSQDSLFIEPGFVDMVLNNQFWSIRESFWTSDSFTMSSYIRTVTGHGFYRGEPYGNNGINTAFSDSSQEDVYYASSEYYRQPIGPLPLGACWAGENWAAVTDPYTRHDDWHSCGRTLVMHWEYLVTLKEGSSRSTAGEKTYYQSLVLIVDSVEFPTGIVTPTRKIVFSSCQGFPWPEDSRTLSVNVCRHGPYPQIQTPPLTGEIFMSASDGQLAKIEIIRGGI